MYPGYSLPRDIKVGADVERRDGRSNARGAVVNGVFLMMVSGRGNRIWWAWDTGVFAVGLILPRTLGRYVAMYMRDIDIRFYNTVTTT